MIKNAVGLIEVKGYSNAIIVADTMIKASPVTLLGIQKAKGFGWMTVEIEGDVGAVTAAIENGASQAESSNSLISKLVISRPATGLGEILEIKEKTDEKTQKEIKSDETEAVENSKKNPPVVSESEKLEKTEVKLEKEKKVSKAVKKKSET